jgi:hypothetical protein
VQRGIHSHFQERFGHNFQFSGASNFERRSRLGHCTFSLRKEHQQPQQAVANKVYVLRNTGALVHYLHKAMFSPTKSALLQAVKNGHLITWPGLTEKAINIHLKLTPATTMRHMNQRRQHIRSNSKTPITSDIEDITTPTTHSGTNTFCLCRLSHPGTTLHGLNGKIYGEVQQGQLVRYGLLCF